MDPEEKKQVQSIIDRFKGHFLPDGGEIVGSINSSSSEFAMNIIAHIVREHVSGSTASYSMKAALQHEFGFKGHFLPDGGETVVSINSSSSEFTMNIIAFIFGEHVSGSTASDSMKAALQHEFGFDEPKAQYSYPNPYPKAQYSYPNPYPKAVLDFFDCLLHAVGYWCAVVVCKLSVFPVYLYISLDIYLLDSKVPPPPEAQYPYPNQYPYPYPYQYPNPPENLEQYFGHKRADAAAILGVSVSKFKRMCRQQGINPWPYPYRKGSSGSVSKPPYQHGEGNTSTARETPSHNVQTGMEGEPVGQNQEANECRRDFMGGPIALNTESGLIMVLRPPDQHGERNTSTACETPSHNVETGMEVEPVGQNPEANVFRRDFMGGPIALNTDGLTFPECSDAVAHSQPMATILDTIPHLTGCSSECAFQVKNQSTQFTSNPYPNGLVDPHPQIALTQILSENMERLEDRRNLLAPLKEPLPEGHVFGSVNWTVRSCSDIALSQPMPTIPHTTGGSEYWRNSLALLEKHLLEENDYGSINLTALSCFDPGPSQPMHTIPHTMPTIPQMMPLLTKRQDMRSVRLKATYGNTTIKFPLPSGYSELKEEVSKRLEFECGSFKLEYKDEEGDSVLIACDDDVRDYLQLLTSLGNQVVKLFVLDKVPNTTNFCDN